MRCGVGLGWAAVAGLALGMAGGSARAAGNEPVPLAGMAPVYQQHRDWLLVCDNALRCEASAMVQDADHAVRIVREAGPDTPITLRLEAIGGSLDPALLRIDDNPTRLSSLSWQTGNRHNAGSELTLTGDAARRAVDDLRDARQLDLGETADDPIVSLMGMTAALLGMDQAQGRLDTPGALVRTGPLRESRVSAAQALPVVPAYPITAPEAPASLAATVRQAQATLLSDRCDPPFDPPFDAPRDSAHALDDAQALVLLECRRNPAQSAFLAFVAPRAQPQAARPLALPAPAGSGVLSDAPLLSSAWFERATGTLTVTHKGRGLADCGYFGQWRFAGAGFALATYLEQQTCTGLPYAWPAWYRSLSQPPSASSTGASNAVSAAIGSAAA